MPICACLAVLVLTAAHTDPHGAAPVPSPLGGLGVSPTVRHRGEQPDLVATGVARRVEAPAKEESLAAAPAGFRSEKSNPKPKPNAAREKKESLAADVSEESLAAAQQLRKGDFVMFQAVQGRREERGIWFPDPLGRDRAVGQISEEPIVTGRGRSVSFISLGKWADGRITKSAKAAGPFETDDSLRLEKITTWSVVGKAQVGTEQIEQSLEIAGLLRIGSGSVPQLEVLKTNPKTSLPGQIVDLTALRPVDHPSAFVASNVSGAVGSSDGCTCSGEDCNACCLCCYATLECCKTTAKVVTCPFWIWFVD